jgi:DNA-binding response OmpR family regulator
MVNGFNAKGITQPLTLVVNTDAAAAVQLAEQLARAGFPSSVASTCPSAIDAIRAQYFGAIVVVAVLDDAECRDCLHTIRRRAPRSWLVIINSTDDSSAKQLFRQCGGDALVRAPFTFEDLATRLVNLSRRERPL